MEQSPNNPPSNRLGAGATEESVVAAVNKSGYPLQLYVSDIFRSIKNFSVAEEWSFVDRDTQELRNTDLLASMSLHGWSPHPKVRPTLSVLVECKQSDLPYIFFESRDKTLLLDCPAVAGLRRPKVTIRTDDDNSTWEMSVINALALHEDVFQTAPIFSHTLSKCVRKGAALELSGSDSYNSVILPLVKALHFFIQSKQPPPSAQYFDAHLAIPIAVLDAPMIGINVTSGKPIMTAVPWVRVLRHEQPEIDEVRGGWGRYWVIDVIHKDFLSEYLEKHLMPFSWRFAERVLRHPTELSNSIGFASGMGKDPWKQVENRLRPLRGDPRPPQRRTHRNVRIKYPTKS